MIVDAHMLIGAWNHAAFLERGCTVADALDILNKGMTLDEQRKRCIFGENALEVLGAPLGGAAS